MPLLGDRTSTASTISQQNRTLPITPKKNQDDNIKKVAVTMPESNASEQQGQLIQFDQTMSLEAIIKDICQKWSLSDPKNYALRFNEKDQKMYITEANRKDVRDGQVLNLTPSAAQTAKQIKLALNGSRLEDKNAALRQLSFLSSDYAFTEEFVKIEGHKLIVDIVQGGNFKGDPLAYTLKSFVCLMDHNILSWNIVEMDFIKRVADCVSVSSNNLDLSCLQCALAILESVIMHCSQQQATVEQIVTPVNIIRHLESPNIEVQKHAIALINALFMKADGVKRSKVADSLRSKSMRNVILSNVIRGQIGDGMAHQLYVLQTLLLNLNEDLMRKSVDVNDPHQIVHRDIEELRRIAFDVDGDANSNTVRRPQTTAKDYKKLGFENSNCPAEDFLTAPPGALALHVMLYFARQHGENYVKVVLENSTRADEHDCPFVQASKKLTMILCDILKIGEPPDDDGLTYYTMFFSHDHPFEEFFCICIQLLNKTWREMRATAHDFKKVLDVVQEQITRVLNQSPTSFEAFRTKIHALTYSEINKLWEKERLEKEGQGAQLKPIIELRKQIKPEIMELIKQQRLNYLIGGTRFAKYSKNGRIRDKFWFWRLAPNHKALHYGDCGESEILPLEHLPNKLPVADIQKLQIGNDCTHINIKAKRGAANSKLAFSLNFENDETDPFCFLASSDTEFDMWTDGLNHLLNNEMTSSQVNKDLETLLSMEIKMRILDTEGIPIPPEAPEIPPSPDNYDFAYLNL